MGGAAIGLPALVNLLISRQAKRLPTARWGTGDRYLSQHGEIVFQCVGEGPPMVLLHSFGPGHSAAEWRPAAEILAQNFRVYAPDLIGWGHSEMPSRTYDSELYMALVCSFLQDVVQGGPAVVVAAGLSAAYAAQAAVDRPELFRALGLVVPLGLGQHSDEPDLKDAILHRFLKFPVLGTAALNLMTTRPALQGYLQREVYSAPAIVDEVLVDEHFLRCHKPGAHGALAAYLSGYLNHNVRESLLDLDLPTWIAWGRRAHNPPVESADLWLQRLPSAGLDILEQSGILPQTESPEEFCRKLQNFLNPMNSPEA